MIISHEPDKCRFVGVSEDGRPVGYIEYSEDDEGKLRATHTAVGTAFRNQGMAGKLLDALVEYAEALKTKVVPVCPYVEAAFQKHPERYRIVAP